MNPRVKSMIMLGLPFVLCVMAIAWMSLSESPPRPPSGLLSSDKVCHALAYAFLTAFAGLVFRLLFSTRLTRWGAAFVFSVAFGGLIEILQKTVTANRRAEWGDLLADAVGACLTLGCVYCCYLIKSRLPHV